MHPCHVNVSHVFHGPQCRPYAITMRTEKHTIFRSSVTLQSGQPSHIILHFQTGKAEESSQVGMPTSPWPAYH